MASAAMLNSPCNIGAVKFEVTVKPSPNLLCARPSIRLNRRRVLTIRSSNEGHDKGSGSGPLRKMGLTDEECEAAVVAGNAPEAPPVPPRPAAPAGTPAVSSLVSLRLIITCKFVECPFWKW